MYLTEVNEIGDEVLKGLIVGSLSLYFISSTFLSHDDYQHILFGVGFLKSPLLTQIYLIPVMPSFLNKADQNRSFAG